MGYKKRSFKKSFKSKKSFYRTSKKVNKLNTVPRGGFRL